MNVKTYIIVTSVVFALVAIIHLVRLVGRWPVIIDGWDMPLWGSAVAAVVTGLLSAAGFRAVQQIQKFIS